MKFSHEIEDLLYIQSSLAYINPKNLYIYKRYQKLIFNEYEQKDLKDFTDSINKSLKVLAKENILLDMTKNTKDYLLGEFNAILWSLYNNSVYKDYIIFNSPAAKIYIYFNQVLPENFNKTRSFKEILESCNEVSGIKIQTELPLKDKDFFLDILNLVKEKRIPFTVESSLEIIEHFKKDSEKYEYDFIKFQLLKEEN